MRVLVLVRLTLIMQSLDFLKRVVWVVHMVMQVIILANILEWKRVWVQGGSTSTAVIGLPGVTSKIGMGTFVQAFAKPRIKMGRSEVYGLLGITSTNLTFAASGPGGSISIVGDSVSDMSYGVGYGISLGESFGLTAEYVSVWSNVTSAYPGFNNSNTNINSFNASVNYKF